MINSVTITGNLTKDADLRTTKSGSYVVRISIANTQRVKKNNEWTDDTSYFDVVKFITDRQKNFYESGLIKGTRVTVFGRLKQETYDGKSRVSIVAEEIDFPFSRKNNETTGGPEEFTSDIPF